LTSSNPQLLSVYQNQGSNRKVDRNFGVRNRASWDEGAESHLIPAKMHPDYKYSVGGHENQGSNVFGGSQGTQATSGGGNMTSSAMMHAKNAHGVKVVGMPNPNKEGEFKTQIGFFQQ
jgi:hypothetical protein